jgi:hypothetical protein
MNTATYRWESAREPGAQGRGAVLLLVWLSLATPATAASFLSTEGELLNYIGVTPNFLNEFGDLVEESPYAHPMKYSANGFAYDITSEPILEIYSRTGFVSTATNSAEIIVSFTRTNVHAAGGLVFLTDAFGAPANGDVRVVMDESNTNTLPVSGGQPAFAGFFTGGYPFAKFRVSSQTPGAYPALDHFWVAEGVPVLAIALSGADAVSIRWPAPATGYVLQSSLSLSNPSWNDVQASPQPIGFFWEVIIPAPESTSFFRLVRR